MTIKDIRNLAVIVFCLLATSGQALTLDEAKSEYRKGNYSPSVSSTLVNGTDAESKAFYNNISFCSSAVSLGNQFLEEGRFKAAIDIFSQVLEKNPTDKNAKRGLETAENEIRKKQQQREDDFNEAKNERSIEKLKAFIAKYPQEEWKQKAKAAIDDITLWNVALDKNTEEAYNAYLVASKSKTFAPEAEYNIGLIKCKKEWNEKVEHTTDVELLRSYISRFAKYDYHLGEVKARLSLKTANQEYENGNFENAYNLYREAEKTQLVEFSRKEEMWYKKASEEHDYKEVVNSMNVGELLRFLQKYKNGTYSKTVSSTIAVIKADSLNAYSSTSDFNEARSFAKDESTAAYVESRIEQAQSAARTRAREYRSEQRREKRELYGPLNTGGIGIDGEMNFDNLYKWDVAAYYKLGRFNHLFNLVLGANVGQFRAHYEDYPRNAYHYSSDEEDYVTISNFQFGLLGELQLRIPVSDRLRLLLAGGIEYGIRGRFNDDEYDTKCEHMISDNTLTAYPKFGIQTRHFELTTYYKFYNDMLDPKFGEMYILNSKDFNHMLGMGMRVYF